MFTEPAMSKMLPDRFAGMQYPKVLVLNLKGTLVHQTYGLGVGVELFKRPGLSTFIYRMSRQYEVCIFGMGDAGEINEVCEALDPKQQMIIGRFGRESTAISKEGKYVKDLSYLNRPMSEIIYIDFDDEFVQYQIENTILLPKFEGQNDDRELIDLIPFLDRKFIKKFTFLITYSFLPIDLAKHPGDVRKEIKRFGRVDGYKKFLETQKRKKEFMEK